jgi:hypothetical protein
MSRNGSIHCKSKKVATFDFDGLVIEVLHSADDADKKENKSKSQCGGDLAESFRNRPMCSICFGAIPSKDEIEMVECKDKFCRLCLINYVQLTPNELIKCPSIECSDLISMERMNKLLGLETSELLPNKESMFPKDFTR